jgi:hypothetical protein
MKIGLLTGFWLLFCIEIAGAQPYLSLEHEGRMIRKKAFVGDVLSIRLKNKERFSGVVDSIALDGYFRMNGQGFRVGGRRFWGAFLSVSSLVYMAGTIVNGWIIGMPANEFRYYTAPLIVFGGGTALAMPWRYSYPVGRKWQFRVLQY